MALAVLAVFLFAYIDLLREEGRALEDFTAQQAELATALARTFEAGNYCILHDLRTLVALDDPMARATAARRLVDDGATYRQAEVFGVDGRVLTDVSADPPRNVAAGSMIDAARERVMDAARQNGMALSEPLEGASAGRGRLSMRFYALKEGDRTALLLVDADRLADGLGGPTSTSGASLERIVLVDPARRWIERDPADAARSGGWRSREEPVPEDLAALLSDMGAGRAGAVQITRATAKLLGLDRRMAVAGFAPVASRVGGPWSIAVIASAMNLRDRAWAGAWRLGASTALGGVVVGLFGILVLRAQRRAFGLAEALRLAEATAELKARSEKIVEAIPIGVLALDPEMRVTSINPRLAALGLTAGDRLAATLPRASAADLATLQDLVAAARAEGRPTARSGLRMRLSTVELRDIDAYAVPLGRADGWSECFLVLHDRTETRHLERSLVRAEKLATIGTLAAGVAHEVGTPLGIIAGRAEQLLSRTPPGEPGDPARKVLTSILTQVDKVSATIRQLLDFARVRPIEAVMVTPAQALATAGALLEHRFRQAKVVLVVDAPARVPAVSGDPGQLEQVFVNLMMNAADACQPGGRVEARAVEREGRIAFEISDDGGGILPEHLPSVLDPFFTTKKRGQGTGLGLTIAADIVKNHGGSLEIESTVGRGTTVRVLLPIAKPAALSRENL